ncbi:hypothetical protein [[Clostridium] fimetarium]|uniref:Deacetylase PdaC domain-containing protein n=1 Tax=[Clostridium] fimetarium TaxID=99656 RepID=A0A1I0QYM7_9FIRM|nr:hypothetical protein [[Clostridium] fimetarium]SEW32739.1 hypothetical protein SAMN05421659_11016 [[Clostridium] fimetarium]
MNCFKKHPYRRTLTIILLAVLLLSGCKENQPNNLSESIPNTSNSESIPNTSNSESIPNTSNFFSYSAKEKSAENHIFFNYPQFKETIANTDEVNELIMEFVELSVQNSCAGEFKGSLKDSTEEWNNKQNSVRTMNISYKITRSDFDYLSVTFDGGFNHIKAAHPLNYFNSLIIDLKKCEVVSLSDLYYINTDFVELVQKKIKEQIRAGLANKLGVLIDEIPKKVEEYLLDLGNEALLEILQQANKEINSGYFCFMTDDALGISVPIAHAYGDHFEIMIAYDELKSFVK